MLKLMIADSSSIFASALAAALDGQFQVQTCTDGSAAMELLPQYQPDVLILNLQLPRTDGLTVLENAAYHPRVILAITMHLSAYVEQSVTSLGVDYTMISPSAEAVVLRLQTLIKHDTFVTEQSDPHAKVACHLHLLNFPTHLDGYRQLCVALPLFAQNPQQLMTKELYPAVARICGCRDGRSVEHSIRKAIRAAWQQKDNAIWRKYFAPGPCGRLSCPTNKAFICRLAEILNAETRT